jgi:hypothetical protein
MGRNNSGIRTAAPGRRGDGPSQAATVAVWRAASKDGRSSAGGRRPAAPYAATDCQARGCSPVSENLSMIMDSPRNSGVRRTVRSIEAADMVYPRNSSSENA